jgi:hypothetical protein
MDRAMADRNAERRALYESILSDPSATHTERLRADERLSELDRVTLAGVETVEHLTAEESLELAESLAAAMPGFVACARAGMGWDPEITPPDDPTELREVLALQEQLIERLERVLASREDALRAWTLHRQLTPAPELGL